MIACDKDINWGIALPSNIQVAHPNWRRDEFERTAVLVEVLQFLPIQGEPMGVIVQVRHRDYHPLVTGSFSVRDSYEALKLLNFLKARTGQTIELIRAELPAVFGGQISA